MQNTNLKQKTLITPFTKPTIILILKIATCAAVLGHIMNMLTSASRSYCFYENKGEYPNIYVVCVSQGNVTCSLLTRIIAAKFLKLLERRGEKCGDAKNVRLMSRTFEMHSLIKLLFLLLHPEIIHALYSIWYIQDSIQSFLSSCRAQVQVPLSH